MRATRVTAYALPVAVLGFIAVAVVTFRELPELIPLRTEAGEITRALARKPFIALTTGLVGLLTLLFGLVRWVLMQPGYDPDGQFSRHIGLRARMMIVLDLLGACGVATVTWTAARCATASRLDHPEVTRLELLIPFVLVLAWGGTGWWWVQRARRR